MYADKRCILIENQFGDSDHDRLRNVSPTPPASMSTSPSGSSRRPDQSTSTPSTS